MTRFDRYQLYERSVQTPKDQVDIFEQIYKDVHNGKAPHSLREDFCGTFMISCEWVKKDPKNHAMGLDISSEPLDYGKKHHYPKLTADEKKRLQILKKNAISVTHPKSDVVAACNFSFYFFMEFKTLVTYFKKARASLKPGGLLLLEMVGGPEMMQEMKERKRFTKNGELWFTYIWDQQWFDPVTHSCRYAIDFKMANGKYHKEAFVYDWRLWTVPEVRAALHEAGFSQSYAYWEKEDKDGNDTGEFHSVKWARNDEAWIAYIVGKK